MNKKKICIADHYIIGQALKGATENIREYVFCDGMKAKTTDRVLKIIRSIDQLKSDLEEEMFRDCKDDIDKLDDIDTNLATEVYF